MTSDDGIIFTDSRNLGDDEGARQSFQKEEEGVSRRVLAEQGIFLDETSPKTADVPPALSKDFNDMSGIEIIPLKEPDEE
ncbi:hypothetical protein AUJ77_01075 [Candidatus Nomurabacteria bacterium CG1_02_43_90]|uniref:Uncharacterized protein n=1 Tax=Candidatus Nomurabacteria bacterium CG1_02_43_90 TaxID=1805281 RepID=A0A1J4V9G9_9BACT|nr:MAG: hypothetical protein AUJ77_01075 [Candidatus Nomurabacteria bacterium CG1_02_43_90]